MGKKSDKAYWKEVRSDAKLRRQKRREKKEWVKAGKTNRHHILNKCRGGTWQKSNILNWDISKHNAWHFLFQNMSFTEVAELLLRTVQIKNSLGD